MSDIQGRQPQSAYGQRQRPRLIEVRQASTINRLSMLLQEYGQTRGMDVKAGDIQRRLGGLFPGRETLQAGVLIDLDRVFGTSQRPMGAPSRDPAIDPRRRAPTGGTQPVSLPGRSAAGQANPPGQKDPYLDAAYTNAIDRVRKQVGTPQQTDDGWLNRPQPTLPHIFQFKQGDTLYNLVEAYKKLHGIDADTMELSNILKEAHGIVDERDIPVGKRINLQTIDADVLAYMERVSQGDFRQMSGKKRDTLRDLSATLKTETTRKPATAAAPKAHPAFGRNLSPSELDTEVTRLCQKYGVNKALIMAQIETESSKNHQQISPAGAVGYLGIMPITAIDTGFSPDDRFDPHKNLEMGVKYMAKLKQRYDGNEERALWAYNAGPTAVRKGIKPQETRDYIVKVQQRKQTYMSG